MQKYRVTFYNKGLFEAGKPTLKSIMGGCEFMADCLSDASALARQEKQKIYRFYREKFGPGLFDQGILVELIQVSHKTY